jgi:hypothetical protein
MDSNNVGRARRIATRLSISLARQAFPPGMRVKHCPKVTGVHSGDRVSPLAASLVAEPELGRAYLVNNLCGYAVIHWDSVPLCDSIERGIP